MSTTASTSQHVYPQHYAYINPIYKESCRLVNGWGHVNNIYVILSQWRSQCFDWFVVEKLQQNNGAAAIETIKQILSAIFRLYEEMYLYQTSILQNCNKLSVFSAYGCTANQLMILTTEMDNCNRCLQASLYQYYNLYVEFRKLISAPIN